jgi:hypothetical protein
MTETSFETTVPHEIMMKTVPNNWMVHVRGLLRAVGPYAAIELVLPGGSLIALLLWLYRRRASVGVSV